MRVSPAAAMNTARVETFSGAANARRKACTKWDEREVAPQSLTHVTATLLTWADGTVRTHGLKAESIPSEMLKPKSTPSPPGSADAAADAETLVEGVCDRV